MQAKFYTDSDEECLDEQSDADFYEIYYDFEDDDEEWDE